MKFSDVNQSEAKKLLNLHPVALLPIGAVEVHGDHLPLATDDYLAQSVAELVDQKLENSILMPPINYGQVWSLRDFPGSVTVSDDTLAHLIADIGESLFQHGAAKLAVINSHVGNCNAIKQATRILYDRCDLKTYSFTYPGAESVIRKVCTAKRPHKVYFHACEIETSYMLYLCEDHVDMTKAVANYPVFPPDFDVSPSPWSKVLKTAVMGDATAATRKKGKAIIDAVVKNIVSIINHS